MSLIVIASERFAEHQTPPGHPESPERAVVMHAVALEWRRQNGEVIAPKLATDDQLARVHAVDYIRQIAGMSGRAVSLDPDTYTSPETPDIARLAAGAAVLAVDRVIGARGDRALVLTRPPGHHAEHARAMGFCFFNNVAVAAAHARHLGAERVAIVDYDVHHGNGTQHAFESDPRVLYLSVHQFPYYPGTGAADEIGTGPGGGYTVNVPLELGATDADYQAVCETLIAPIVRQFAPDVLLVSAGFDAHERDPLAGMRLTTGGYRAMTAALAELADECCDGRMVVVTEGGYELSALGDCLQTAISVLAPDTCERPAWPQPSARSSRGVLGVRRAASALAGFWKLTG